MVLIPYTIRLLTVDDLIEKRPPQVRARGIHGIVPSARVQLDYIRPEYLSKGVTAFQHHAKGQFVFDLDADGEMVTVLLHRAFPVTESGNPEYASFEQLDQLLETMGRPDCLLQRDAYSTVWAGKDFHTELMTALLLWLVRRRHARWTWSSDDHGVMDLIDWQIREWGLEQHLAKPHLGFAESWAAYSAKRDALVSNPLDPPVGPQMTPLVGRGIPERTIRSLALKGVRTMEDLSTRTPSELLGFVNFGRKSLFAVTEALAADGRALAGAGDPEEAALIDDARRLFSPPPDPTVETDPSRTDVRPE